MTRFFIYNWKNLQTSLSPDRTLQFSIFFYQTDKVYQFFFLFFFILQYYDICSWVRPLCTFSQQIFCCWHKSIAHWEYFVNMNSRSSHVRICNYISFKAHTALLYIGKAMFRIFHFYAKQPIWIHLKLKIWW